MVMELTIRRPALRLSERECACLFFLREVGDPSGPGQLRSHSLLLAWEACSGGLLRMMSQLDPHCGRHHFGQPGHGRRHPVAKLSREALQF